MSRYLPNDVFELEPAPKDPERKRRAWLLDLRGWMFLGMGLGGILIVALIVTADASYAGIDGMLAVSASVPQPEAPAITKIPFLGGLISAIHDGAPAFFAPSPDSVGGLAPGTPPPQPANLPPSLTQPTPTPIQTVQTVPTPSTATSRPSPSAAAPSPTPSPSPSATPSPQQGGPVATPTPAPTASPSATPTLAITTDRGATAIVDLADLVPGDSLTRTITVQNAGSLAFRYMLSATQTASTLLWTDPTDGLQLTVRDAGGTVLYAGPLRGLGSLAGPTILAPGTAERLSYTVDFPRTASNSFQGLTQDLTLVFDAIEFP